MLGRDYFRSYRLSKLIFFIFFPQETFQKVVAKYGGVMALRIAEWIGQCEMVAGGGPAKTTYWVADIMEPFSSGRTIGTIVIPVERLLEVPAWHVVSVTYGL
jgi:hypothetical protein